MNGSKYGNMLKKRLNLYMVVQIPMKLFVTMKHDEAFCHKNSVHSNLQRPVSTSKSLIGQETALTFSQQKTHVLTKTHSVS